MFLIDSHRHNGSSKFFQLWTCHILTMQLDQRRSENNRVKSNMMPSPRFYKDFFLSIISHFEHVIGLLLSENNKSGQLEYKRIWSLQCFIKRQCTILLSGAISTQPLFTDGFVIWIMAQFFNVGTLCQYKISSMQRSRDSGFYYPMTSSPFIYPHCYLGLF